MWKVFPPMRECFSDKWRNPTLTALRGFLRRFPLTRKPRPKTHVPQWGQSQKFMIICVCCMQELEYHTVRYAVGRLHSSPLTKSQTRLCHSQRGRKFNCLRLSSVEKRVSTSKNWNVPEKAVMCVYGLTAFNTICPRKSSLKRISSIPLKLWLTVLSSKRALFPD